MFKELIEGLTMFELRVLATIIFLVLSLFFTWLLLKIFPFFKKLNWKILAILFVILKILDTHSTHLIFVKTKFYEPELNVIFHLFYKVFGVEPILSNILVNIIATLVAIFLIKVFVERKRYLIAYFCVIMAFVVVISNYIGYFFFI